MKDEFLEYLTLLGQNAYKLLYGILTAIFGYFIPIKDFVHLLIFLLIVDMLFGYWANKKIRGESFSMKKVWTVTFPRMAVGVILIISSYLWDVVYNQTTVETYRIIGWVLSGAVIVSIVQNGYKITQWSALNEVKNILIDKLPIKKQSK